MPVDHPRDAAPRPVNLAHLHAIVFAFGGSAAVHPVGADMRTEICIGAPPTGRSGVAGLRVTERQQTFAKAAFASVGLAGPIDPRSGTVVAGRPQFEDVSEIGCEPKGPFDYAAPAELYFPSAVGRHRPLIYRRFASAVEALTFALASLSGPILAAAVLEVAGERYDATQIHALGYPKPSRLTTTASV